MFYFHPYLGKISNLTNIFALVRSGSPSFTAAVHPGSCESSRKCHHRPCGTAGFTRRSGSIECAIPTGISISSVTSLQHVWKCYFLGDPSVSSAAFERIQRCGSGPIWSSYRRDAWTGHVGDVQFPYLLQALLLRFTPFITIGFRPRFL